MLGTPVQTLHATSLPPQFPELETLPNIDINIKCGNSLISRYALDADIKKALKNSKWTIDSYRLAVMTYRNAQSKEEKREMEKLIAQIKNDFESDVAANDKRVLKLNKAKGELFALTTQTTLFDRTKAEKTTWDKQVKTLTDNIFSLETELEGIRSNKIYENAFEWRFEFPEVLNEEGDFVGFDVVIGNPPYGVSLTSNDIEYFRKNYKCIVGHTEIYYLFIELGLLKILKPNQLLSFIVPNAWMSNKYAKGIREIILSLDLAEIINFNKKIVFEDAQVETCIFRIENKERNKVVSVGNSFDKTFPFDSSFWLKDDNYLINFSEDNVLQSLLLKINSIKDTLCDYLDISNGCKPYQAGYGRNDLGLPLTEANVKSRIYHSNAKEDDSFYLELKGKHIHPYMIKISNDYLKWGTWLMSPKDAKYYFQSKILIRQIIGEKFIAAIDNTNSIADQTLYICVPFENQSISLEFVLGVINSKLYGFYFRKYYSEEDDLFPKIKVNELKRLPFQKPTSIQEDSIKSKVVQIINLKNSNPTSDTTALESEIDRLVYQLYGLTDEEIKIVEGN